MKLRKNKVVVVVLLDPFKDEETAVRWQQQEVKVTQGTKIFVRNSRNGMKLQQTKKNKSFPLQLGKTKFVLMLQ